VFRDLHDGSTEENVIHKPSLCHSLDLKEEPPSYTTSTNTLFDVSLIMHGISRRNALFLFCSFGACHYCGEELDRDENRYENRRASSSTILQNRIAYTLTYETASVESGLYMVTQ
jgi:hypothetical protein